MTFRYISAEHCEWNEFGEWSTCSKTCDGGDQTRTRTIRTEEKCGGNACTGTEIETQSCNGTFTGR